MPPDPIAPVVVLDLWANRFGQCLCQVLAWCISDNGVSEGNYVVSTPAQCLCAPCCLNSRDTILFSGRGCGAHIYKSQFVTKFRLTPVASWCGDRFSIESWQGVADPHRCLCGGRNGPGDLFHGRCGLGRVGYSSASESSLSIFTVLPVGILSSRELPPFALLGLPEGLMATLVRGLSHTSGKR